MKESVIPWEQQAIKADEACKLFGMSRERFLRGIACKPGFPKRVTSRPAAWVAGDILAYRNKMLQRQDYAKK